MTRIQKTWPFFWPVVACFVLSVSCARFQKTETTTKDTDLGIPTELANKFAVTDVKAPMQAPETKLEKKTARVQAKKTKTAQAARAASVAFPNRLVAGKQPFFPGERHAFDVTYFGATAGNVELVVAPNKFIGNREVFDFKGYARSTSIFALFYRLNDAIESFMDKDTLFSNKFVMKLDESLQQRDLIELYDQISHKLHYWTRTDHKTKGKSSDQFDVKIEPFTQDVLSAVFYLRTLPLEVGKDFTFPMVSNGKPWTVIAHVVRREEIVTKAGTFNAFVIKPDTKFEGILQTTADSFIWISDDEHRSILKIDAKVKIGSVIAYLSGLEYGKP